MIAELRLPQVEWWGGEHIQLGGSTQVLCGGYSLITTPEKGDSVLLKHNVASIKTEYKVTNSRGFFHMSNINFSDKIK